MVVKDRLVLFTSKQLKGLFIVMFSLSNICVRGKDVDIIVTGNLSEQVGIGARIEVSARLGELDVPFPFFGNNFCKLPILGLGSNECPVPKGNTRLGFTGTLPAAAPNVRI